MPDHAVNPNALMRIAVIDDDVNIHDSLRILLEKLAFQPSFFFDTTNFLGSAKAESFNCILLDVMFGDDINRGLDLLKHFHDHKVATPVIMMSGFRDEHIRLRAAKLGAKAFLQKPILASALGEALHEALTPEKHRKFAPLVDPAVFAQMLNAPTALDFKQWQSVLDCAESHLGENLSVKLKALTHLQAKVFLIVAQDEGANAHHLSQRLGIRVKAGGLGVLNLEGIWTRYEDADKQLSEMAKLSQDKAIKKMQEIYAAPIQPTLIKERLAQIRAAGVTVAGALSPQRTAEFHKAVIDAGVDIFVIRGTTVSAEHVSDKTAPLNLKKFIYELDVPVIVGGCATAQGALHLMRSGAAGVLVGFGGGSAHTTKTVLGISVPMASAVAEVASARRDYLDESGGRYVHVIADGSVSTSGEIAKAVACGADAIMMGSPLAKAAEAPGKGWHWGLEAHHGELPRGNRVQVGTVGTLNEVLTGPSNTSDGSMNLFGALRRSMATCGYSDLKEFQRVEVVIQP